MELFDIIVMPTIAFGEQTTTWTNGVRFNEGCFVQSLAGYVHRRNFGQRLWAEWRNVFKLHCGQDCQRLNRTRGIHSGGKGPIPSYYGSVAGSLLFGLKSQGAGAIISGHIPLTASPDKSPPGRSRAETILHHNPAPSVECHPHACLRNVPSWRRFLGLPQHRGQHPFRNRDSRWNP